MGHSFTQKVYLFCLSKECPSSLCSVAAVHVMRHSFLLQKWLTYGKNICVETVEPVNPTEDMANHCLNKITSSSLFHSYFVSLICLLY
jgi:hypothetical protein